MSIAGPILSVVFIAVVAFMLLKKYYPHAVLLLAGLLMYVAAHLLGYQTVPLYETTGHIGFDLFALIRESFAQTNAGVGLLIMAIGGFVAYINAIGASRALVNVAVRPLNLLRKYPLAAASAVIPISQVLFAAIPSAAGLGLLLMASVFPILVTLGVSRLSAVSVITASTAMGLGPASAITVRASDIADLPPVEYFAASQLPLFIPLSVFLSVVYFIVNRHFDRTSPPEAPSKTYDEKSAHEQAPPVYAVIPVLPILLLLIFSEVTGITDGAVTLDTTTAMFVSLALAMVFEWIRKRKFGAVLASLKEFWNGMGNIFKTVVTLIIAAEIFSGGLIALGFIDGMLLLSDNFGFGYVGFGIVLSAMIFLSAMLMGSGNAAFFSFGPLVPDIAAKLGVSSVSLILPMNFAASMGRTVSPVAGVIIATAEIAEVNVFQLVKRNLVPVISAFLFMLIIHFL